MTERTKHLFDFSAQDIANAARAEADYHDGRIAYWQSELETARARVKETAGIRFVEQAVTGGTRLDVVVDYGDVVAFRRMNDAWLKIDKHRTARDRLRSDAALYGTQATRHYQLDAEDVAAFRLNGRDRED